MREDPAANVAVYQSVRHIFGSKDSPTYGNYALRRTATDNKSEFPEATFSVLNNFYMEDYLESSQAVEEVMKKSQYLVYLLTLGGCSFTKFVGNVPNLVRTLTHEA